MTATEPEEDEQPATEYTWAIGCDHEFLAASERGEVFGVEYDADADLYRYLRRKHENCSATTEVVGLNPAGDAPIR